jgi:hypothetical protein
MYRAGGPVDYPVENVNTADLEGVFWYLHNEVVTSVPRKYGIDRIRRYKFTVHNTQEFWNVHKRQFSPFLAFDAARCTTLDNGQDLCSLIFGHYGYVVGCQTVAQDKAMYLSDRVTTTSCPPNSYQCRAPVWYSLPGPCPSGGIPQDIIDANMATQNIDEWKTADCKYHNPGGRCSAATGAATCSYSYEPAGEIMLDELVGIPNYQVFWNTSYEQCTIDVQAGTKTGPCLKNKEYDELTDAGVGTTFWDGRGDAEKCKTRVDAARVLFKAKFSDQPAELIPPTCDFDTVYGGEWQWQPNHTLGVEDPWWTINSR